MRKALYTVTVCFAAIMCVIIFAPHTVKASKIDQEMVCSIENTVVSDENITMPASDSGGNGSNDEDWYNLSVENGIPQLPHAVDYSSKEGLIKYLKPGDLVYEPVGGLGITGHTAMVYDILYSEEYNQYYVVLIEAVSEGVSYGLLTPTRFIEKECQIRRLVNATQVQIDNAISWAKNQIGKSYGIDTTKSPYGNNQNWYCSELVWASFYWQGIYLDSDDNDISGGSIVWPYEINDYDYASMVMHYQYDTSCVSIDNTNHVITCNSEIITEPHNYIALNSCYQKCALCNNIQQTAAHVLTSRFEQLNSTSHYAYCECGTYAIVDHNYIESVTKKSCIDCGYSEYINHVHSYTYESCRDGACHYKSCICGILVKENCLGYAQGGGESTCISCGQTIGGKGLILLNNNGIVTAVPSNMSDEVKKYL